MSTKILELLDDDCSPHVANAFTQVATDYLNATRDRTRRVSTAHTPPELAARFDERLPTGTKSIDEVIARLRDDYLPDANHLYHPRYVGHQVSAPLPAAIWTESLVAAVNNSLAVFEMSPSATAIEFQVMRWMCDLVGFGAAAGGTMTSGGTEATFTGLLAARAAILPNAWEEGVGANPPLLLCGEHAHYAVTRAAAQLGIGMRNVVAIRSRHHAMDYDALRSAIETAQRGGRAIMAVVATAGSTATGSFDDLATIGALCAEYDIWLHIDGAHGASALLSQRHKHRVRGIERARTIAWDPHKMMLLPLQAGMLLAREEADLANAFAQRAPYLFHGAHGERVWDQGTRSFLCSHRADVMKLWVALQRYGADGIGAVYDHLCDVTRAMYEAINERADFVALHEPESNILCFRYVGTGSVRDEAELDALNLHMRESYNRSGEGWITTTQLDGRRVLRVTIMNPRTTQNDVVEVLDGLSKVGLRAQSPQP